STAYDDEDDDDFFRKSKRGRQAHTAAPPYGSSKTARSQASIFGDVDYDAGKGGSRIHNLGVSTFIAAVGCALALWVRDNDVSSSAVFVGVYILAAGYFIIMSFRQRVATAVVFFLSLMVYNYMAVGQVLSGIFEALDVFILFFYIGCIFLSQIVHTHIAK
ncbi:MAG: hypothetical protein ACOCWR_08145, partial [Oceanidesulfovibrio sp.]